jgi:hypothetical protein
LPRFLLCPSPLSFMISSLSFYKIGKIAGLGKDSAASDYRPRRRFPYITSVLETRSSDKRVYNLTV